MCLGGSFEPANSQTTYELHGFRRCGIYALIQIILTFIGLMFIASGEALFATKFIYNVIIGAIIIIIFNILPNGRPFFLNLYRMGRVYIVFDANDREVVLISTRLGGFMKSTHKIISSYSQFRGIAVHHETNHILFLSRREESLLLKQIGEVLPENKESIQSILEEISLYWFSNRESDGFFGITYVDFSDGLVAENNIKINIKYDFYLKRSDTWKPKNNMLASNKKRRIHHDDDQYLDAKAKDVNRFNSYNGASVDLASEENVVVDYV